MITLDYDGTQLVLRAGEELDRDIIKTINGVHSTGAKTFTLPARIPAYVDAEIVVTADEGEITDAAKEWWAFAQQAAEQLLALKDETRYEPVQLGSYTLRPDQEADAQFLAAVGSGQNLHPMRHGKTLVTLRTLDILDKWPALIAVKPKTIDDIVNQTRAAFPNRSLAVLPSGMTPAQRRKELAKGADIVIIGHTLLEEHSKIAWYPIKAEQRAKEVKKGKYDAKELNDYGFRVVVGDESHRLKNPKAAVTRALWALGDAAEHRYMGTGTHAPNSEEEYWPTLRFTFPHLFPAKTKWIDRYIHRVRNRYARWECRGWNKANREKWDYVFSLMSVRRERVGGPKQVTRVIGVDLDKAAAKVYRELAEHGMTWIDDEMISATDSMSERHRLIEFASGTPVVRGEKIIALKMPSAKIEALLEVLEESDDKTIVACERRTLADLTIEVLREHGIPTVAVVGDMNAKQTAEAVAAFQEGDAQVIVLTAAGAEGLELSKATRTVMLQVSYDLAFNMQITNRNTSNQQEAETVELIFIYAKGTLDEAVQEAYVKKDERFHANMRDKSWVKLHRFGSADAG